MAPSQAVAGDVMDLDCTLPLEAIRELTGVIYGLREIAFNPRSRVISFEKDGFGRVNVYYTTGTVGTAINHPVQGRTQLFRRHVGMSELLEILENLRVHTGKGYKTRANQPINFTTPSHRPLPAEPLRYPSDGRYFDGIYNAVNCDEGRRNWRHETGSAPQSVWVDPNYQAEFSQSRQVKEEVASDNESDWDEGAEDSDGQVQDEGEDFQGTLSDIEESEEAYARPAVQPGSKRKANVDLRDTIEHSRQKRPRIEVASLERSQEELIRWRRGTRIDSYLSHPAFEHDFSMLDPSKVCSLGLSDRGFMACLEEGTLVYDGIPSELQRRLVGRYRKADNPAVVFVAFGSRDRYFVRFNDGFWWVNTTNTNAQLTEALHSLPGPAVVAFGESDDSWVAVSTSTKKVVHSANIPLKLAAVLRGNPNRSVEAVSMGPYGQWFVRFDDNRVKYWLWDDRLGTRVTAVRAQRNSVRSITFGCDGSWSIMYSEPQRLVRRVGA